MKRLFWLTSEFRSLPEFFSAGSESLSSRRMSRDDWAAFVYALAGDLEGLFTIGECMKDETLPSRIWVEYSSRASLAMLMFCSLC